MIDNSTFGKRSYVGKIIYGVWPLCQISGMQVPDMAGMGVVVVRISAFGECIRPCGPPCSSEYVHFSNKRSFFTCLTTVLYVHSSKVLCIQYVRY